MKRIVILGAGFGGLHTAMRLGRALKWGGLHECEIILVDKNDYHTYTPTLYEVATASKDVADFTKLKKIVTFPIEKIIKHLPVKFVCDEVSEIDFAANRNEIHLKSGYNIRYDYLVISLGSVMNDFGIPGVKEFGLPFKSFTDALLIRDRIWNAVTKDSQPGGQTKPLEVVIGGGGSTGVELAGEVRLWLSQLGKKYNRPANVTICEAGPNILMGFSENIISKVSARLKKIGVNISAGKAIKSVGANEIILNDDTRMSADVFIWAGGVKANNVAEDMPMKSEKGRMDVSSAMLCSPENADLTTLSAGANTILAGKIFGVGDIACATNPKTGKPIPMVARAALSEAKVAAKNIIREINRKPHIEYHPMDYPYVIPVGGKYAVAKLGNIVISGFWGWILKGLVELNYLLSIMSLTRAVFTWLRGLWIFIQNDRLG